MWNDRVFNFPNTASMLPAVGYQPNDPGQPAGAMLGNTTLAPKPWPWPVPVLHLLIGNPGTARDRAPIPVVNQYGPLPYNQLFIAGFVGKSQG